MTTRHVPITPATCYVDGSVGAGFSVEWWAACDWSKAYLDRGPSPAGNAGPYLHVPREDCVHRIYPRVRDEASAACEERLRELGYRVAKAKKGVEK